MQTILQTFVKDHLRLWNTSARLADGSPAGNELTREVARQDFLRQHD